VALTNRDRVSKALDALRDGLGPWVDQKMQERYQRDALLEACTLNGNDKLMAKKPLAEWDLSGLFSVLLGGWQNIFAQFLGNSDRSMVFELKEVRNKWAHQDPFSTNDLYRALDTAERLLNTVCASDASEQIAKMKSDVLRLQFDEQARGERRKSSGAFLSPLLGNNLKPWREVITPHPDVATGRFSQAEFAADLWQVYKKEGAEEYANPVEFFRRTFLTGSLKDLLLNACRRLSGDGGDPVIQLQTNFGGGKTHSMLALYHAFSGVQAVDLPGVEELLKKEGIKALPTAKRAVIVGNKISPSTPNKKEDGTIVHTLWGELVWQLGGKAAYEKIKQDDLNGTSPGDILREVFNECGPCLILVDEWVAYARQLPDQNDNQTKPLCGGGFEAQFSFAQALTESAKLAKNCLLLVSLPASDTAGSPHARVEDVEVGGVRGREALERLRNVVGRLESSWKPASAEEGFEIVRRRLFQQMDTDSCKQRDVTARLFGDMYRSQKSEFPTDVQSTEYEERIKGAYPIHPEVFDRLYTDWSTLVKFQRTRGVLRLMATVIHYLWEQGDKNPLIMPSLIPMDDPRIQNELLRYLSDNWQPIVEKDVDGPLSLPVRTDSDNPNLGRIHACRRVARTVFMGSAPTSTGSNKGLEDRYVKLGCVLPGETPALFGDALRRLSTTATYLYQDGSRFWFSTSPTVTKLAEDKAELLKREPDKVVAELDRRLRTIFKERDRFSKIHVFPQVPGDVPDDMGTRLVVISQDHLNAKTEPNPAQEFAANILASRGTGPRLFANTLVFLAADSARYAGLETALRDYLAWKSVNDNKVEHNLTPFQVKQAETQLKSKEASVEAQLPEAFQSILVPSQVNPQAPITWKVISLRGGDGFLAKRVADKLIRDSEIYHKLAGTILRMEMDKVPLWRGQNHVKVSQVVEDFARYLYLPRVLGPELVIEAVVDGVGSLSWQNETFAYADNFDEAKKRYIGLKHGQNLRLPDSDPPGLLVQSDAARKQLESGAGTDPTGGGGGGGTDPVGGDTGDGGDGGKDPKPPIKKVVLKRFHGSATLSSIRMGADAARIADEILSHLVNHPESTVNVRLEIEADLPGGASDGLIRTVSENCRSLRFTSQGFEQE